MALNYIWAGLFLVGILVALIRFIVLWAETGTFFAGNDILQGLSDNLLDQATVGFNLALAMTAILTFWCGMMKIGEAGGVIQLFSRWMHPIFSRIFPDIPKNHPASGSIMMNFSANMLGMDNAATPMGLKAMAQLQEINPDKSTISNSQIMFLVLNTAGFTLIPATIIAARASFTPAAADPTDIFIPTLLTTFLGSLTALILTCSIQRISLKQPPLILFLGLSAGIIFAFYQIVSGLDKETLAMLSKFLSVSIIFAFISLFMVMALVRKVRLYDVFVDGAKEGFTTAVRIIPYLVGMLVAIAVFRASGAFDFILLGVYKFFNLFFSDPQFVHALPTGLMRSLSASGSKGFLLDVWGNSAFGIDSFVGKMTSVMQGSSEPRFMWLRYTAEVLVCKTHVTCWGLGC
ncbi:MAG: nucleoside recognition domain-containing protein [Flavobacteriales bacterium]